MTSPSESLEGAPVAVIDIGSNSIKLLVARRDRDGGIVKVMHAVEETRIGTGVSGSPPRLLDTAMERAIASIKLLLCQAAPFQPRDVRIVATSAVRDAANQDEFSARLFDATTLVLEVLSGAEEARLIGRGIACDRSVPVESTFYLFDLGGGSLEMLAFRDGAVEHLASLQLGCVRMTELCIPHPQYPISDDALQAVGRHVRGAIVDSRFLFDLPDGTPAVVTGGTATTFRAAQAGASNTSLEASAPTLNVVDLEAFAFRLARLPVEARAEIPGIPRARADVLPAALITLREVAQFARVDRLQHSFFNLRYGLAIEMLEDKAPR